MKSKNIFLFKIKGTVFFLSLIIALFFLFSTTRSNINYAKLIHKNTYQYENSLAYTFKIADKLIGTGDVKMTIEKNKIKGIALGKGMTTQCDINLNTNLEGVIENKKGNVIVTISGEGHPQNIPIPGKIKFDGPLEGVIKNKRLNLVGKINIKGRLASFAGFKKKEELVIEITDPAFARTLTEIQNQEELALLPQANTL